MAVASELGVPASGVPASGVPASGVPAWAVPELEVPERVVPESAKGLASELGAVSARALEQGLAARGFAERT